MTTAVFLIAALNLGAGFAVAVFADSPWSLALPTWPRRRARPPSPGEETSDDFGSEAVGDHSTGHFGRVEAAQIQADSVVESLLWTVHLAALDARKALLPIDRSWRGPEPVLLEDKLREVGSQWAEDLEAWAELLSHEKSDEELGELAATAEELLLDQQFLAKSTVEDLLEDTAKISEPETARLIADLFRTLDAVRDFTAESLASLLRVNERCDKLPERWRMDEASGTLSRLGMENLFTDWARDDPECIRMASCVFIDIDRAASINESIGTAQTDQALAAFGDLMLDLVRTDRGFDRVVRYDGQAYLLFFGDTAVNNAASGVERIRQTIEASSFVSGGTTISLSVTCAVAELPRHDSLAAFIDRLKKGIAEAKAAGRNRTFADDGTGPKAVTLPQYQVERREIRLSEQ